MLARLWPVLAIASLSLALASSASADRAPLPGPCDFSELGEACEEKGAKGICAEKTCSRLAYKDGERTSVEYECKRCKTTPPEPAKAEPVKAEPVKAEAASEPPTKATPPEELPAEESKAPTPETSATSKGLCAVGPQPTGAPLLLLGLLLFFRRGR